MRNFSLKKSAALVGGMLLSGLAAAQTTSPFQDAVTDALADVATMGAALVGVAAAGVGFGIAIKYVKKIRGAA